MRKLLRLSKMLLVAVGMLAGASNAWAADKEVTLNCTNSITIVGQTSYGENGADYSSLIRLNSYAGQGGAGALAFTLDENWDASKVKSAILRLYMNSKDNKNRSGNILIHKLDAYPDLTANSSTPYSDGKHIVYKETSGTNKRYTFSTATIATVSASCYNAYAPITEQYFDVDITSHIQSLSTKSAGDLVYLGLDINDWAFVGTIGAYGNTNAPKLVVTYTDATLYTASFNESNGLTPTITIYSNSDRTVVVSNGSLTNGTTYYYTASLAEYEDYNNSFTVNGANPSVNFTMTPKTAVSSLKVNYKKDSEIVYTDNQDATGLFVGDYKDVPYRMYIYEGGKLYKAGTSGGSTYYAKNTKLEANTVVEITVTEVNLAGGSVEMFADLDDVTAENAGVRASYCSAYNNTAYTSSETLSPGTYKFIVKAQNKGRGSSVKVGDQTIFSITDVNASTGSWTDKEFNDVTIFTEGKVSFAKGASAIDCYDIIIAIRTGDATIPATIKTAGWSTLYTDYALDFSGTGLTAYTATCDGTKVTLTEVENVPAGTGVVLKGDAKTYDIPVAASSSTAKGDLKGSTTESTYWNAFPGEYLYMLAMNDGKAQFTRVTAGEIPAGKAYLRVVQDTYAPSLNIDLGGTTGINAVQGSEFTVNGEYYNLAGQRVAQPTKGLYIVNGKKVVVK